MIIVHITPAGVTDVEFQASTNFFQDLDLAVWPLVRSELDRLDRKLKRSAKEALGWRKGNPREFPCQKSLLHSDEIRPGLGKRGM